MLLNYWTIHMLSASKENTKHRLQLYYERLNKQPKNEEEIKKEIDDLKQKEKELEKRLKAARKNPQKEQFTFRKNLGDNPLIIDNLKAAVEGQGQQSLVIAPCSAGKTYTFLKTIAPMYKEKNIIFAVPLAMQAQQNGQYSTKANPIYTVYGSGLKIEPYDAQCVSTTYDQVRQLNNREWTDSWLRLTTLIIDEAHQLVTEEYRQKAIDSIFVAARRILRAGGSVIYLTATPRKIMSNEFFDRAGGNKVKIIDCKQVDKDGRQLPAVKQKEITIIRKDRKTSTNNTLIEMLEKIKENDGKAIVLYNSKKNIDKVINKLNQSNIKAIRIASEDKEKRRIFDEKKGYLVTGEEFVNKAYGSIVETESLDETDVFLCTSVIEVGVNIKGIKGSNGKITQPKNLTAIFVCRNEKDFDMDKINQFISRIRFATDEAIILMNTPIKSKSEVRTYKDIHAEVLKAAENQQNINMNFGDAADFKTLENTEEIKLIKKSLKGVEIDEVKVNCVAYDVYDQQYWEADGLTADMVSQELNVPAHTEYIKNGKSKKIEVKIKGEEQAIIDICMDDVAFKDLQSQYHYNYDNELITKLFKMTNGRAVLESARTHAILGVVDRSTIPAIAIMDAKNQRIYVEEKTGMVVPHSGPGNTLLLDYAEKIALKAIATELGTETKLKHLVQYYNFVVHNGKPEDIKNITNDKHTQAKIDYLILTERFGKMMKLNENQYFANSFKRLFMIGYSLSKKALDMLLKEAHYVNLNSCERKSPTIVSLLSKSNKAFAEYMVIRYPEEFLKDSRGRKIFPNGLKGKTITARDIATIATNMGTSVAKIYKSYKKESTYRAQDVYEHILAIYSCKDRLSTQDRLVIDKERTRLHQITVDKVKINLSDIDNIIESIIASLRSLNDYTPTERSATLLKAWQALRAVAGDTTCKGMTKLFKDALLQTDTKATNRLITELQSMRH